MKIGFEQEFHVELIEGTLSKEELVLAKQLEKDLFLYERVES